MASIADGRPVTVRAAVQSDSGALLILAAGFATSFAVEPDAFHRSFASLLASSGACLAVAELDGYVLGYVLGFVHTTFYANGPVGWVEEIAVEAENRRTGIGRLLMHHFELWAAAQDCKLIALATRRAEEFYRALGYSESAVYFRKVL